MEYESASGNLHRPTSGFSRRVDRFLNARCFAVSLITFRLERLAPQIGLEKE